MIPARWTSESVRVDFPWSTGVYLSAQFLYVLEWVCSNSHLQVFAKHDMVFEAIVGFDLA
jgi:hypothetical protein